MMSQKNNVSDYVAFSANQLKFIDWLACGKYGRQPATQKAFADEIGINPRTLERWKKGQNGFTKADFWDAVTARARELNREHLAIVYESVRIEASKGSFQHQKLMLEMAGEYTDRKEVSVTGGLLIDLNEPEE